MYQLGNFRIDITNSKIYRDGRLMDVEPKTFQLLVYFINTPNQIVTRDDLIKYLWSGRIISDNTINKHIANLRKLLGDDPKNVKYVETVSKQGYRLICPVTTISKITPSFLNKLSKPFFPLIVTSFVSLFVILLAIAIFFNKNNNSTPFKSVEISRMEGVEFSPREIPSSNKVLFLNQKLSQSANTLWIKDLQTNHVKNIDIGQYEISHLISATKRFDAVHIYFSADFDNQCNIYKAKLEQFTTLSNITVLFSCQLIKVQDIVLNAESEVMYYTARKSDESSYQVYKYDIQRNNHELIKQPTAEAAGNRNIDLSPDGTKLLIMNSSSLNQTTFYVLDLNRQTLLRHKSFDFLVTEAIWDHDSEHVFYSTAPPSHQIVRSHITANNEDNNEFTIVNVTHYLSNDMSLFENDQLLFGTRQVNFSIDKLLPFDASQTFFINSIVYDTIPALFHHQPKYFFVSNRSGKNQVYLGNLTTGEATNVLNIQQHKVFTSLQVSPNDKYLLIADQSTVWKVPVNELFKLISPIVDLKTYEVFTSKVQIHNINWLSDEHFVVSTENTEKPHTFFNGNNQLDTLAFKRWDYFFVDHDNLSNVYMIEKSTGKVYLSSLTAILEVKQKPNQHLKITHLGLNNLLPYTYFDPQIRGDNLFFVTNENRQFYLYRFSISKPELISRQKLRGYYEYDVNKSGLVVSQLKTIQGDIHSVPLK